MNSPSTDQDSRHILLKRVTNASVAVAVTLIAIKLFAFFLTNSVSLLSSLIDSILDMFASLINLIAIRQSLIPADDEHRFGHGKAEPLAGLGQAAFIIGSSVFLLFEVIHRLIQPVPVQQSGIGILVMVISLMMTISLVFYQRHVIRMTNSIAVHADSIHYSSDIVLNLGVICALVLSHNFGWIYVDPVFAMCIAVFIIYSAWKIASQSLDQLMDKELPDEDRKKILHIARGHRLVRGVYDLRTRASGQDIFIQLHLEVDAKILLYDAHAITDEVQKKIEATYSHADVIIHANPPNE